MNDNLETIDEVVGRLPHPASFRAPYIEVQRRVRKDEDLTPENPSAFEQVVFQNKGTHWERVDRGGAPTEINRLSMPKAEH